MFRGFRFKSWLRDWLSVGFSVVFYSPADICQDSTLNEDMTIFSHIFSSSLFINTLAAMRVTGGSLENGFQYHERHQWVIELYIVYMES
jgi:hypothetical protein